LSPGTRFGAELTNAMKRPSAERAGRVLAPFAWSPSVVTLTRCVIWADAVPARKSASGDAGSRRVLTRWIPSRRPGHESGLRRIERARGRTAAEDDWIAVDHLVPALLAAPNLVARRARARGDRRVARGEVGDEDQAGFGGDRVQPPDRAGDAADALA